ncbi:TolB family protein [Pseudoxanthomonas sp. 10H]|uniref:TolB family protein n=1 Tax=Pseudoxanthomonas sp. 10H TaxID=3242729 RepID=UPI003556EC08
MPMRALVIVPCILSAAACVAASAADLPLPAPVRWTPPALSTGQYESSPVFSPDGRELFFFRAPPAFDRYRLLHARCGGTEWDAPREPAFAAPAGALETDPAYSPDGAWLYYASDRAHAGDLDIWRVPRHADGRWGEPERLPSPVNSPQTELLPRPQADGRLLFGSSREGGPGGRDLYLATPRAGGGWDLAPLPSPANTAADEYEADLSRDGRVLVVVANRGTRSHLYVYDRHGEAWRERGRVPARSDVFQVGPLLSPDGKRLLFAQAVGERSGEFFLVDLAPDADRAWPPACAGTP